MVLVKNMLMKCVSNRNIVIIVFLKTMSLIMIIETDMHTKATFIKVVKVDINFGLLCLTIYT